MSNATFCTQCEPQGFRRITFHQDRPDVLAVYTVTVEGDRATCPVLLSNGNRVEETEAGLGLGRIVALHYC
jgi:aminopeptidase N